MSLSGKSVLVTGGTGSFGRAFANAALNIHGACRVIVLSRDELKQHEMRVAFGDDARLSFFIGDVRDEERLRRAFEARPDVVVHAAALKQVPACEYNPFEAIKTNVLGAQNVINAAIDTGVPKVIALSTDKAVNPINLYGATKLCAEKLFIQGNSYVGTRSTRFSCVRYGNVIGSRGSVVPVFLEQRAAGMVRVTDERMTRFWLTLDQGAEFVIRSIERMKGGEVFIPRIPSMGLMDLAASIAPDCAVKVTGIRPGEKLHECLMSADEARHARAFDDFYVVLPEFHWWSDAEWDDGQPLPEGFSYTSDTNDAWLSHEDLQQLSAPPGK